MVHVVIVLMKEEPTCHRVLIFRLHAQRVARGCVLSRAHYPGLCCAPRFFVEKSFNRKHIRTRQIRQIRQAGARTTPPGGSHTRTSRARRHTNTHAATAHHHVRTTTSLFNETTRTYATSE